MTDHPTAALEEYLAQLDGAWTAFRSALDPATLAATTPSGWTVQGMVGHVAFWLETVPPFVTGAFRGDPSAFQFTFPSGYVAGDGDWPSADEHNRREAAWAAEQPPEAVLRRLDEAFTRTRAYVADTVTPEELEAQARYFQEVLDHLDGHRTTDLAG